MPIGFYLSDIGLIVLALAALASTRFQARRQLVRRWNLLLPGVLATLGSVSNLVFPHAADLFNLQIVTAGVIGFLIGAARGAFMGMDYDQRWGLVRLHDGRDELVVASLFSLAAVIHFAIEMTINRVNPYMPSGVLALNLTGGYLLGRSVIGWIRAGRIDHTDLHN
jgi:hypothetical protein